VFANERYMSFDPCENCGNVQKFQLRKGQRNPSGDRPAFKNVSKLRGVSNRSIRKTKNGA